jgi:hypothetical protein
MRSVITGAYKSKANRDSGFIKKEKWSELGFNRALK